MSTCVWHTIHPYSCRISDVHVVSITPDSDSTSSLTQYTFTQPPLPHPATKLSGYTLPPSCPSHLPVSQLASQLDKLPALRFSGHPRLESFTRRQDTGQALTGHPEKLKSGRRSSHSPSWQRYDVGGSTVFSEPRWCWRFYSFLQFSILQFL